MSSVRSTLLMVAIAVLTVQAAPSHSFALDAAHEHYGSEPAVLPPAHLHAAAPALPSTAFFYPAPLSVPAPAPVFQALPEPAPVFQHYFPASAPAALAPLPLLSPAPLLPAALPLPLTKVPPVQEAVPLALSSYRAIPGPKTTTHHISIGYAFPAQAYGRLVTPHTHLHSAPLALPNHHHHSLF